MPQPEQSIVQRELSCDLSDQDLLERADTMAECELQAQRLRSERTRLNAQLREQTDRRAELATVIETKKETRDVSCKWEPDHRRKMWLLKRLDKKSAEPVEQREMTPADLQGKLPGVSGDEAPAGNGKRKRATKATGKPRGRKSAAN